MGKVSYWFLRVLNLLIFLQNFVSKYFHQLFQKGIRSYPLWLGFYVFISNQYSFFFASLYFETFIINFLCLISYLYSDTKPENKLVVCFLLNRNYVLIVQVIDSVDTSISEKPQSELFKHDYSSSGKCSGT